MRIIMTKKEVAELKNIMETIEVGSVKDMLASIESSPLVNIEKSKNSVVMDVDANYMEEYLEEITDTVTVITPLCHGIYNGLVSAGTRIDKIIRKHMNRKSVTPAEEKKSTKIEIEIR